MIVKTKQRITKNRNKKSTLFKYLIIIIYKHKLNRKHYVMLGGQYRGSIANTYLLNVCVQ